MNRLTAIILAVLLAGCAARSYTVTSPAPALLEPIVRAERDIATGNTSAALSSLHDAEKAATAVAEQDVQTQNDLATAQATIAEHRNDWFGARTHRLAHIILWLIPIGTLLGGMLLFAGNTSTVLHSIAAVLSGGVHVAVLIVTAVIRRVRGGKE